MQKIRDIGLLEAIEIVVVVALLVFLAFRATDEARRRAAEPQKVTDIEYYDMQCGGR